MILKTIKKLFDERWLGIIGLIFLVFFFILTFYLNKKVNDGDLIFFVSNKKPPSLILNNFSAIRTNGNGFIILSFDAKKLNYYGNSKNGEIFQPRIFIADSLNKKRMQLSASNASYHDNDGSFILKNNVNIKITNNINDSFFFQSDHVVIDTKNSQINAIGNVNATIN